MRRRLAAVLLAVPLAVRATSAAADMFSPPFIADDGERAVCSLLNVSKKDLTVVIEVRFNNGAVAAASDTLVVAPGTLVLQSFDGTNASRLHCAFLGKVTPKKARAAGEVAVGNLTKLVVPAQ